MVRKESQNWKEREEERDNGRGKIKEREDRNERKEEKTIGKKEEEGRRKWSRANNQTRRTKESETG